MKRLKVFTHPTCSTSKKVTDWLDENEATYERVNIKETPPSKAFFLDILQRGWSRSSIMNTSGELYREMHLKDRVKDLSDEEVAEMLSKEGMLVKRPVVVDELSNNVTFGAKMDQIEEVWKNEI